MFELDELDKRILQQLQRDSSLTNQELAEKVHASAPTCLRRVRNLQENGVIQKQVAIVDPQKTGSTLTAIVEVSLDVQTAEANTAFEKEVNGENAVLQCYRVSTGPDFILVIQVADMPAYHELVHRLFTARKNVRNVRTFFSVNRSKFETYINDL
ncbi:MAG: Lrp/AsnC family transcriptional regulator [Advenella sp.]|jgi:Lrp/AsnC family leucine-responsive transcriptional regulator|uniref:Lrp/AsnC family transcriptional regulator n=1 Tax=unclassified Advenella TaxID=2685285 RepID=UPI00145E9E2F|nr:MULTISPECIES: Lrp/AsnC family transcriptional regulator [unclassified Advenella]MDD3758576.1 Lrp/AsnC family transcriptional regulator [Advenella sp.]NLN68728.1 Lrp/AsnC family transcriptional regulator [Alcaligenaceae bacterium]